MSTLEGSLASFEGVADVSIIIPICFDNPLKEEALELISDALTLRRRIILPVTATVGAYHVATRYLRISKLSVKKILEGLLMSRSPALYPYVSPELVIDALDYSTVYSVESWDGYLIALARSLGIRIIYSLDEELLKIKDIAVINPFPKEKVEEYHHYIEHVF
jgi:predicted nucleic acid-binding protein